VRPDAIVAMHVTAPIPDPARVLADLLDQVLAKPVAVPST
jgi:putative polyketide hydroxylase